MGGSAFHRDGHDFIGCRLLLEYDRLALAGAAVIARFAVFSWVELTRFGGHLIP